MKETIRFVVRLIATPIFVVTFGIFWLGFLFILGLVFQLFSFLSYDSFSWKEHLNDCNEFFSEPLLSIWNKK